MNQREHLVYMANQIARNFATMGDMDAAAATADHIVNFWDPRMKAAILGDAPGLSPIAAGAIERLRSESATTLQPHTTELDRIDRTGGKRRLPLL